MLQIVFTTKQIEIPPLELSSREIGACVEFLGIVRELEGVQPLEGLQYEAYEPMARRHLERIFQELQAPGTACGILFIHRLGWVPVGEPSLFVRVTAPHRAEAFAVCSAAIDRMKQDVPIWKRLARA